MSIGKQDKQFSHLENMKTPFENQDIVYLDAQIFNNTTTLKRAEYNANYNAPICGKPEDYYFAINRFAISHMAIPIFFMQDNYYSVTVARYASRNAYAQRLAPLAEDQQFLEYTIDPSGNYNQWGAAAPSNQPIYSYKQFTNIMNAAIGTSYFNCGFANVQLDPGPPPETVQAPPRIVYDSDDEKFKLYVNAVNTNLNLDPATAQDQYCVIYMNAPLFQLFQFWDAFFHGYNQALGKDYSIDPYTYTDIGFPLNYEVGGRFPIPDPLTWPDDIGFYWIEIEQERSALYLLNGIQSIVFTSNSLTMTKEFVSADVGKITSIPILADFVPNMSSGRDLSQYQYFANELRLINLNNSTPITSLQFDVKVQARDGRLYDLYLEPGETISVKFVFALKSLYNSQFSNGYDFANEQAYQMRLSDKGTHGQHGLVGADVGNLNLSQLGGIAQGDIVRAALAGPSDAITKAQLTGGKKRGRPRRS